MNYQERIRKTRKNMSKSFAKLADYLLDYYIEASFMTATELAHELNLDAATVVRFSQFLGYPGFPQLINDIRDHVKKDILIHPKEASTPNSLPFLINSAMDELAYNINKTKKALDVEELNKIIQHILNSKRIFIIAEDSARFLAQNLVIFLEQGNYPAILNQPGTNGIARIANIASEGDFAIAVDLSSESTILTHALNIAKENGAKTACIVSSPSSPTARTADIVLSARTQPSFGINTITINAIIYTIYYVLRRRAPERFLTMHSAISDTIKTLETVKI